MAKLINITANTTTKNIIPSREVNLGTPACEFVGLEPFLVSNRKTKRPPSIQNTMEQNMLVAQLQGTCFVDDATRATTEENLFWQAQMLSLEQESSDFLNYTCPMCKDKGFEIISCLNCKMRFEDDDIEQSVAFGDTEVNIFYPKEPVNYGQLEFEDPEPIVHSVPNLTDLGIGSQIGMQFDHEDRRLSEIIQNYMEQPLPASEAIRAQNSLSKRALKGLKNMVMPRRNPYSKLSALQLIAVLRDVYIESLMTDSEAIDDSLEEHLMILRDVDQHPRLLKKFKRDHVMQCLRLRLITKPIPYMVVIHVEAAFKKLNATEFEA